MTVRKRRLKSTAMKIIHFEEIDSTNEYCKRCGEEQDLIVYADSQTGGRGTKGRSFVSDRGGVYVTVMRHYYNFASKDAFKIMINSCVAVCETLSSFGLNPIIRWANDVLTGGKKICGTLIENTFTGDKISRSIVGVGLNVNNELPPELGQIATTMYGQSKKPYDVSAVRKILINNLRREYSVDDYRKYINWFNNKVILRTELGEVEAVALGIENDGRLIVDIGGEIKKISSAEVSLRL